MLRPDHPQLHDRMSAQQRAQAWRERLSRPAQSSEVDSPAAQVLQHLRSVGRWMLLFGCATAAAALCVAPLWVVPSALLLTMGVWLIATGLQLARQMRSALWRCIAVLRSVCTGENLSRLVFVVGTLLALWNLSGLQDERPKRDASTFRAP